MIWDSARFSRDEKRNGKQQITEIKSHRQWGSTSSETTNRRQNTDGMRRVPEFRSSVKSETIESHDRVAHERREFFS